MCSEGKTQAQAQGFKRTAISAEENGGVYVVKYMIKGISLLLLLAVGIVALLALPAMARHLEKQPTALAVPSFYQSVYGRELTPQEIAGGPIFYRQRVYYGYGNIPKGRFTYGSRQSKTYASSRPRETPTTFGRPRAAQYEAVKYERSRGARYEQAGISEAFQWRENLARRREYISERYSAAGIARAQTQRPYRPGRGEPIPQ